jgi:hypothetical protein
VLPPRSAVPNQRRAGLHDHGNDPLDVIRAHYWTTSTCSRRSVRLSMRSLLRRTGRGSGPEKEARQDCDGTRPAPLAPSGQAAAQASAFGRAGAGNHERTSRNKARSQSQRGSRPRSPSHSPPPSGLRWRSSQSHRRVTGAGGAGVRSLGILREVGASANASRLPSGSRIYTWRTPTTSIQPTLCATL